VGAKETQYYGGFTVMNYGSHQPKGIDAMQVELGKNVRFDKQRRQTLIKDMAEAIKRFLLAYYPMTQTQ
jgi:hypothetical protein